MRAHTLEARTATLNKVRLQNEYLNEELASASRTITQLLGNSTIEVIIESKADESDEDDEDDEGARDGGEDNWSHEFRMAAFTYAITTERIKRQESALCAKPRHVSRKCMPSTHGCGSSSMKRCGPVPLQRKRFGSRRASRDPVEIREVRERGGANV